jgi:hypothetical protein
MGLAPFFEEVYGDLARLVFFYRRKKGGEKHHEEEDCLRFGGMRGVGIDGRRSGFRSSSRDSMRRARH